MLIDQIPEDADRALVRDSVRKLIEWQHEAEVMLQNLPRRANDITIPPREVPRPAVWSSSAVKEEREWRPVNDGKVFWMPPSGTMVPLSQVPKDILDRWLNEQEASGEGPQSDNAQGA